MAASDVANSPHWPDYAPNPGKLDTAEGIYVSLLHLVKHGFAGPADQRRSIMRSMRDARVFSVDPDEALARSLRGLQYAQSLGGGGGLGALKATVAHAADLEKPSSTCFPTMLITYPGKVKLPPQMGVILAPDDAEAAILDHGYWMLGHLITPTDWWQFGAILLDANDGRGLGIAVIVSGIYHGGEWEKGSTFAGVPWTVCELVHDLYDNATVVLDRGSHRRQRKALAGKPPKGWRPRPFYTVELRDKVADARPPQASDSRRSQTYRSDVRAHERFLVKRGPLPMKDGYRENLAGRGWVICTWGELPSDLAARLKVRHVRGRREGEWVAVKVSQVKAHIRPADESLPLIPAVRR